jgi:hypothetical protein
LKKNQLKKYLYSIGRYTMGLSSSKVESHNQEVKVNETPQTTSTIEQPVTQQVVTEPVVIQPATQVTVDEPLMNSTVETDNPDEVLEKYIEKPGTKIEVAPVEVAAADDVVKKTKRKNKNKSKQQTDRPSS